MIIILDVEATCWADDMMRSKQKELSEVIEIGAIKVGRDFRVVSEFNSFIRPVSYPLLTTYCKELTSIDQAQVDSAKTYKEVWEDFLEWADDCCTIGSWGAYDRNILSRQCAENGLDFKFVHMNMKERFGRIGLAKAVQLNGLKFNGTQHRALVDARAVYDIFYKNMSA
jgi:inhibitor of KinA sporulation pathway (predicted exonuclease)